MPFRDCIDVRNDDPRLAFFRRALDKRKYVMCREGYGTVKAILPRGPVASAVFIDPPALDSPQLQPLMYWWLKFYSSVRSSIPMVGYSHLDIEIWADKKKQRQRRSVGAPAPSAKPNEPSA